MPVSLSLPPRGRVERHIEGGDGNFKVSHTRKTAERAVVEMRRAKNRTAASRAAVFVSGAGLLS
jgi:hypothetical protein